MKDKSDKVLSDGDTVLVRGIVSDIDQTGRELWITLSGVGTGVENPSPDAARRIKLKAGDVEKVG